MSKFKNQGTISFCHLVKLSYVLNDSKKSSAETMADWCLQLDTTEAIKQSFEYALNKKCGVVRAVNFKV